LKHLTKRLTLGPVDSQDLAMTLGEPPLFH
jgi:hypothetical protein